MIRDRGGGGRQGNPKAYVAVGLVRIATGRPATVQCHPQGRIAFLTRIGYAYQLSKIGSGGDAKPRKVGKVAWVHKYAEARGEGKIFGTYELAKGKGHPDIRASYIRNQESKILF